MTRTSRKTQDPHERNMEIALFRYGLISALLFDPLAAGELEQALRQIASKSYTIPYSSRTKVGISTLRRYLKLYRQGGFDALRPSTRSDQRMPRAFPPEVLQKAITLREEQPARTTPMIVELLKRHPELKEASGLNAHTLGTHLRQQGKTRRLLADKPRSYQRFEREHANSLWQGDAMLGPWLPDPNAPGKKRRAHLFCFLDDHSRLVPYAEFFLAEARPRLERVLKVGILRRSLPKALYVDNGKVYAAHQFESYYPRHKPVQLSANAIACSVVRCPPFDHSSSNAISPSLVRSLVKAAVLSFSATCSSGARMRTRKVSAAAQS
jgi:putative transposase